MEAAKKQKPLASFLQKTCSPAEEPTPFNEAADAAVARVWTAFRMQGV
jgi:hypothetical protein